MSGKRHAELHLQLVTPVFRTGEDEHLAHWTDMDDKVLTTSIGNCILT
jgi:hypothetical protein